MKNRLAFIVVIIGIAMVSCNENGSDHSATSKADTAATHDQIINITENIAGNLSRDSTFTIFVDALKKTDLIEILNKPGPFIVFAPTNKAFENLSDGMM